MLASSPDLAGQIESCIQDADSFYTLTFRPPQAAKPDEYHFLQIGLARHGDSAHFPVGYYNQLFYGDSQIPGLRLVTATQFRDIVTNHSMLAGHWADLVPEILSFQVTERLSEQNTDQLLNRLHDPVARAAVQAAANEAAFLPPPHSETISDAPSDAVAQQSMLKAAASYLSHLTPELPNFIATRKTVVLEQGFSNRDPSATAFERVPFHVAEDWTGTVSYRNGKEVVHGGDPQASAKSQPIYGVFGPILAYTTSVALNLPDSVRWSRWERGRGGRLAVFRFSVPIEKTLYYRISGCCLPGTGESYDLLPAYHGEFAIDPSSGSILRVQVQTELSDFVPADRSDVMVTYGPVRLGEKTYIVPLRSVAVYRGRTLLVQKQEDWNTSFQTWGPFSTRISELTFEHYRLFQTDMRILPGFTPLPEGDSKTLSPH